MPPNGLYRSWSFVDGLVCQCSDTAYGSAAIDSVASAPCESITPIPDNLKGLIPESCEVRPPTIVTPALQRPLRAWSLKRYSEPQKYGPSKTKFWAMWGLNGGLTVFQVESAVHRAHEHNGQLESGAGPLYGINLGVFAIALAKSLPIKRATPEEASGWWMKPLVGDCLQIAGIAYWRSH